MFLTYGSLLYRPFLGTTGHFWNEIRKEQNIKFIMCMNGVGAQVQVYFALFKLIHYKMAYRISRLTNDEK